MRVIAGRYGGRSLRAPRGSTTRPTSDRVREAIFSMLASVEHARVLDLFAGSGALGIEALSRGAASAVFVERDRSALASLRANLAALQLAEPLALVRERDALLALQDALAAGHTFDLVFLDPPYALAETLAPKLADALATLLARDGRAVVESDRRAPLPLRLPLLRERRYGDTSIRIHRRDDG